MLENKLGGRGYIGRTSRLSMAAIDMALHCCVLSIGGVVCAGSLRS